MVTQKMHENYMNLALEEAKTAFQAGEVPIGAVVIDAEGKCIGRGFNSVELDHTQTAHAEMKALVEATQHTKNWRLEGCTIYVTLEPCSMCFAALQLSRISVIVFGASSPIFGYKKDLDCFVRPFQNSLVIKQGICAKECSDLLKMFFEKHR